MQPERLARPNRCAFMGHSVSAMSPLPTLKLKPNAKPRVLAGHPWVFANEVEALLPAELDGRLDRGHGMASMKHRAKQLQGQCLVESGPGYGTVIRLTLPLTRATELA